MILILSLLIQSNASAQKNYAFAYDIDTTLIKGNSCDTFKTMEYFSVRGKYPESSHSLLQKVRKAVADYNTPVRQNGFITFRFTVNCEGIPSAYKLFMTDEDYQTKEFDKELVQLLFRFIKGLKEWKSRPTNGRYTAEYYNYYLSFQLKDGKIISLAP